VIRSTRELVLKRIAAQIPEEEKIAVADYVIVNDKIMDLMPNVTAIHTQLLSSN
jgi:dephospho-CoA kinase